MSRAEREKGKRFEQEVARQLRERGFAAERTSNGRLQSGAGDIRGVPGLSIECKRCETISLPAWLRQAIADAPDGTAPSVVFRRNGEKSWAVVPWSWLLDVLARLADAEAAEDEVSGRTGEQG